MIKFMLNNLKSGLVVLGLFVMIGVLTLTFAFRNKPVETTKKKVFAVDQWYSITPATQNTNPNLITITGNISAPPLTSLTDCAQTNNPGNYCAVLLRFPSLSTAPTISSGSVQNALTTHSATIVTTTGTNGYSRLP